MTIKKLITDRYKHLLFKRKLASWYFVYRNTMDILITVGLFCKSFILIFPKELVSYKDLRFLSLYEEKFRFLIPYKKPFTHFIIFNMLYLSLVVYKLPYGCLTVFILKNLNLIVYIRPNLDFIIYNVDFIVYNLPYASLILYKIYPKQIIISMFQNTAIWKWYKSTFTYNFRPHLYPFTIREYFVGKDTVVQLDYNISCYDSDNGNYCDPQVFMDMLFPIIATRKNIFRINVYAHFTSNDTVSLLNANEFYRRARNKPYSAVKQLIRMYDSVAGGQNERYRDEYNEPYVTTFIRCKYIFRQKKKN